MDKLLIQTSEYIYRFLLKLYPSNFKKEFGQEMVYIFSEQLTEIYAKNGNLGVLGLWARTFNDVIKSVVIQHVKNKKGSAFMQSKSFIRVFAITGLILLLPLIAMQFTSEVHWSISDFIIAGVLLMVTGLLIELTLNKVKSAPHRATVVLTILAMFLITWIELAVGIFGTPFAGN